MNKKHLVTAIVRKVCKRQECDVIYVYDTNILYYYYYLFIHQYLLFLDSFKVKNRQILKIGSLLNFKNA